MAVIYLSNIRKSGSAEITKDFGPGFYCTIIKEQAERWAKRYDKKIVSIYEVRLNHESEH